MMEREDSGDGGWGCKMVKTGEVTKIIETGQANLPAPVAQTSENMLVSPNHVILLGSAKIRSQS